MATTPNYGWVTPAPTDFVTDLPADFETFADAVDDTVKDLNPGTTAGDLDYYTSSTAKARLGIGTAGQILAVNSGATAPEWIAAPTGGSLTLLETITFNGVASYTSASIAGTYKAIYCVVRNFKPATDNRGLLMRVNGITSTSYQHVTGFLSTAGFVQSSAEISANLDDTVDDGIVIITIADYANTSTIKVIESKSIGFNATTSTETTWRYSFTPVNTTNAITTLTFFANSGNITSGEVLIYGVN